MVLDCVIGLLGDRLNGGRGLSGFLLLFTLHPKFARFFLSRAITRMAISVVCTKCRARFNVSDKFAGQTGPCPKCKNPITIPQATEVTIHEPDRPTTTSKSGRMPTAPIVFEEKPVSPVLITLIVAGLLALLLAAFAAGRIFPATDGNPGVPNWLLVATAVVIALPATRIGYAVVRDKELEPYAGRPLALRVLACSLVYAGLWWVRGALSPGELEIWQWTFIAPFFLFAGGLAAVASFDLDWGVGVTHYSLYVVITALMRFLAGYPPV